MTDVNFTRRGVLVGTAGGIAMSRTALTGPALAADTQHVPPVTPTEGSARVSLQVNGKPLMLMVD